MSDPITLSKPQPGTPAAYTAPNQQQAASGQFRQLTAQAQQSPTQMPDPATASPDDAGKQSLQERNIRYSLDDEFVSDQENMIKTATQRLEQRRLTLQTHKDRFNFMVIGGTASERAINKKADAPLSTNVNNAKQSSSAMPASEETTPSCATTVATVNQSNSDKPPEAATGRQANDTRQLDTSKSTDVKTAARTLGTDDEPETRVTTATITTTTETIHDQVVMPTSGETNLVAGIIIIPSEIVPAAEPIDLQKATSQTSLSTTEYGSASFTESLDQQTEACATPDSDTPASIAHCRKFTIAYGKKHKIYTTTEMPFSSGLDELKQQLVAAIDNFRNVEKSKSNKMVVQVTSRIKTSEGDEGTEDVSPIYVSFRETPKSIVKRQQRKPSTEITEFMISQLRKKEKEKEKIYAEDNLAQECLPTGEMAMNGEDSSASAADVSQPREDKAASNLPGADSPANTQPVEDNSGPDNTEENQAKDDTTRDGLPRDDTAKSD